jgi:hypothetical protein
MSDAAKMALALLLAALLFWSAWSSRPIPHSPGETAPEPPTQSSARDAPTLTHDGYRIEALARFEVRARVLSTETYRFGREADLSPEDLALGWGRMSDTTFIDQLNIRQGVRYYSYSWPHDPPLPPSEIISSSANMHIIPGNDDAAQSLRKVRVGNIVDIRGYLVRADAPDGWHWVSSLSRTDSGGGACELVWAESIDRE